MLSLQLYYVCRIDIHCSGVKIPSGPMKDAEGKTESNSVSCWNNSSQNGTSAYILLSVGQSLEHLFEALAMCYFCLVYHSYVTAATENMYKISQLNNYSMDTTIYYKLQLALHPPAQCKLQSASMCLQLCAHQ